MLPVVCASICEINKPLNYPKLLYITQSGSLFYMLFSDFWSLSSMYIYFGLLILGLLIFRSTDFSFPLYKISVDSIFFVHVVFWVQSHSRKYVQLTWYIPNSWQPPENSQLLLGHAIIACSWDPCARLSWRDEQTPTIVFRACQRNPTKSTNSYWATKM